MRERMRLLALCIAMGAATGCATQQQQLAARQPAAIDTALARARFDMNCPAATAIVLSQDYIQPAVQGPFVNGMTRMEYTIGITGCDQRRTYIIMCQEGTQTCFPAAAAGSRFGDLGERLQGAP